MSLLQTEPQREYSAAVCRKLLAAKPDVILITGSMCFEMLHHFEIKGVAVFLRVKRRVMERVSRCTGAIIFDSVSHLDAVDHEYWVCSSFVCCVSG